MSPDTALRFAGLPVEAEAIIKRLKGIDEPAERKILLYELLDPRDRPSAAEGLLRGLRVNVTSKMHNIHQYPSNRSKHRECFQDFQTSVLPRDKLSAENFDSLGAENLCPASRLRASPDPQSSRWRTMDDCSLRRWATNSCTRPRIPPCWRGRLLNFSLKAQTAPNCAPLPVTIPALETVKAILSPRHSREMAGFSAFSFLSFVFLGASKPQFGIPWLSESRKGFLWK
jgi:hypothetical protein